MTSSKGTMCIAALALLAFVSHAAIGSDAIDGDVPALAISVDANGDDTASIPDFDGDGTIGFGDFVIFAGVFGARQGDEKYESTYDLNGDGEIGFSDFVIFAQNFGKEALSPFVAIPDANLRAAIEAALGKDSGAPITQAEMTTLTRLRASGANISNLTGLEYAGKLTELDLASNLITDVSALAGLTNLSSLFLGSNDISDISALASLTRLNLLWLSGNSITDVSALAGLTNLRHLFLGGNNISDISALAGLTNLNRLILPSNNIKIISALAGLTNLTELDVAFNEIADISALAGLTNLMEVDLNFNSITDVSALSGMTNLRDLWLLGNPLNDVTVNDQIPALKSSGVRVQFDYFRTGDFQIELVLLDSLSEKQERVLQFVARRWMAVIVEDLPDYQFTKGWSGRCGDQSYEIPAGERIDDLRIYVDRTELRGIAGYGGPRVLRENSHLPVVGCMVFNSRARQVLNVGLHETAHVLGFGTIWSTLGYLKDFSPDDPNTDAHFNGPLAVTAFEEAGGRDYRGAKVPVDQHDGGHWRWEVLWGELMGRGPDMLSAITVQSLADLGYGVDVAQADAYTLPSAAAGKTAARVATSRPSVSVPGVDLTRATISPSRDADLYGQGKMADGRSFIFPDRRWTGRQESAERVWGRGMNIDLADERQMWGTVPPASAEPELTCGAGLMNEPIYVVDKKGRVVRTIRQ